MTKKIVFGAALALVIVGLMAPSASAVCGTSKSVSTFNPGTGLYNYWKTTLTGPGTTLVAKIWQPGGADVTGTCNADPGILYFGGVPGDIGLHINLSDACVQPQAACASGVLAVMATVTGSNPLTPAKKETQFLTTQAPETPAGNITFDFSTFGDHQFASLPRPQVTASSRALNNINLNVSLGQVTSGLYEGTGPLITGYNILSKLAAADPGRLASAYDALPISTASSTNGAPALSSTSVDCTGNLLSRWVVTQLVTPNGPSPTVSEATRVSCDPALANPKYRIVPKKGMGTGTIRN